jgi:hypothetical protein
MADDHIKRQVLINYIKAHPHSDDHTNRTQKSSLAHNQNFKCTWITHYSIVHYSFFVDTIIQMDNGVRDDL